LSKEVGDIHQQCLTPLENAAIIAALFDVETEEKKIARQIVMLQIVVTLIGASIAYSMKGTPQFAIAVLSGGGISVLNGALLAWRMTRETLHPAPEAHHQLRLLYFYAAERFLVVVVLLCLCIAVLKLLPLALLGGFVMGQAVLPAGRLFLSRFKTE
jgi:ATP synthase protein I